MTKTPKGKWPGAGRVAFLARAQTIQQMVEAGYPVIAIYKQHEGELGISYSQFARYVARYIGSPWRYEQTGISNRPTVDTPPAPPIEEQPGRGARTVKDTRASKPAFKHDATSGRDRDDLI